MENKIFLYDVRRDSTNHFSDDYLIPVPHSGASAVNENLFIFNMAKRPYDLVMYGIRKGSDNYGGNKIISLSISQPVSFVTHFSGEYFRHPDENNWQHLGRAAVRTGLDYAVGQVIPFYKTLSCAAEVANYCWKRNGGTQALYQFENIVFDRRFVNNITQHLGSDLSDQTKQDLALVWGHDLFEAREEALGAWGTLAKIHEIKGAVIDGIGNVLFIHHQKPTSSVPSVEAGMIAGTSTVNIGDSKVITGGEEPSYDFSKFNPQKTWLAQCQADMEHNPYAVQARAEQIFSPPQKTFGDFLEDHVKIDSWNNGFSITIGQKNFFDQQADPFKTPDDVFGPIKKAINRWNELQAAYDVLDNYMWPYGERLNQLSSDVGMVLQEIKALFTTALDKTADVTQKVREIEENLRSFKQRYKEINDGIVAVLATKDHKPESIHNFWGDGIDKHIKKWFGIELPRLRTYGKQKYLFDMDQTLRDSITAITDEFNVNKIAIYYNHQDWDAVISAFKERYGGAINISEANFRDGLLYSIAQQKINGQDLPIVSDLIRKGCQSHVKGLSQDEHLPLLKKYAILLMRDENTAIENIGVIQFCFDQSLLLEDSGFWLRSLSNLYMMQGQYKQSEALFKQWIAVHPDHQDTDQIKFIFGRVQHALGLHSEADATIASINDQSIVDQAILSLYYLPSIEILHEDTDSHAITHKKLDTVEDSINSGPQTHKVLLSNEDEGIESDLAVARLTVKKQKQTVWAGNLETGKPKLLKQLRGAAQMIDGTTPSQLKKQDKNNQNGRGYNHSFVQTKGPNEKSIPSQAKKQTTTAGLINKLSIEKSEHTQAKIEPSDIKQEVSSEPSLEPKKTILFETEANFYKNIGDTNGFNEKLNHLFDDPKSNSSDMLRFFLNFDLEQVLLDGYFEDFYAKFLICISSNQIKPNDATAYAARLAEFVESHLKMLDAESTTQNHSKHIAIINDALSVISRNNSLFSETQINSYAARFNQQIQKLHYSTLEGIESLRLSAQEILAHSNKRFELQAEFSKGWHERGMQIAEVSQYLLDKVRNIFPDHLPENYYLAIDGAIECWSRFHEIFSNKEGVISCDSFFSVLAGVSILGRNLAQYFYSESQSYLENFHRFHGETPEEAAERFSQLLNKRFERFQYLVLADVCAVTTGIIVSREFFLGLGDKSLPGTGALYLAHYTARVGIQAYRWYQESILRSSGRYSESPMNAILGGAAHGFAQNQWMQYRVLIGGALSFLSRINLMPHILWSTSKTITGILAEQLIANKIIEQATYAATTTVLSSAATKVLLGLNVATAALLVHDAIQYGTLIYGDNKLMNLMKRFEEAENIEKEAADFAHSGNQEKATQLFDQAKSIYQDIEKAFAFLDYRLNSSEQLYLKQELGKLHAKLAYSNTTQASEVFDDALTVLSEDAMFNREKSWRYKYVASDAHSIYRDDADRHVPKYARLAGQAFLKMGCTLTKTCANKIAAFEKEIGEIILTDQERTEINRITDVMKLHGLQGEVNDFTQRPVGVYIFDEKTKEIKGNETIHHDHQKLSADLSSVKLHHHEHDDAKKILQATADLHFGRFPSAGDASQPMSALSLVLSPCSFISGRAMDLYAYFIGTNPGFHDEHEKKYNFSKKNLAPAFSAKKAKFDLFFADLSFRAFMQVINVCFWKSGFSEDSLWPRTTYAFLAFIKEILFKNIFDKIREWSATKPTEGWQDFIQKGSFLTRLVLPFLSLLLPSLESASKDPRQAIFMSVLIGILLLLNGFSFGLFGYNLLISGLSFATDPAACFLGILFTSHLLVSQLLPILHYILQLNLLADAFGRNDKGIQKENASFLLKTIQFFRTSTVFALMNWLSSIYYFCNMHALNEVLTTYQISENIALWLLGGVGKPFAFLASECLAFFMNNLNIVGAAGLSVTAIGIYLIKAIIDIIQNRVEFPAQPNPDYSTHWMSYINCLTSFNLWSFFNATPQAHQHLSSESLPVVEGETINQSSSSTHQAEFTADSRNQVPPFQPIYTAGARSTLFQSDSKIIQDLRFNPGHQELQFIGFRMAADY